MEVRELMTSDPGVCTMDQPIREAAEMMIDCDCGAVPVVENMDSMRLMGIVTDRDLAVRAVAKGLDAETTRVSECMSTDLSCVNPEASIEEAERIMEDRQVRRVPVVDSENCVLGMVSLADIALSRGPHQAAQVVQEVSRPNEVNEHAPYLS